MNIIDITEEYNEILFAGNNPSDYFPWKDFKYEDGYTHVKIGNEIYEFTKHGPTEVIATIDSYANYY